MKSLPNPPLLKRNNSNNDGTQIELLIKLLYRSLLGREADQAGLSHYSALLRDGTIDDRTLASILIGSAEFREAADARSAFAGYVRTQSMDCEFLIPNDPTLAFELADPQGYEPWVLPYFLELCRPGCTVLDIGASIGAFCLPAARRVQESGHVYAIEASPFNCRLLAQSIALNNFNNIDLLPIGVSDTLGYARMIRQTHTNNNALETGGPLMPSELLSHDLVPTVPLDLLRPHLRRIDIMKLDIEGMEYRACRGAFGLIESDRPLIFLEYSPKFQKRLSEVEGSDLLKLFVEFGYTFEILHRDRPRAMLEVANPIEIIDRAWEDHSKDGGSHLDLCLHPTRPGVVCAP
jgi:FkbM family methyltransferase